ncbi:MAG: LamG-like jellyroll fold domain-containing protein, partial [Thermoplasmatota archaeon]
MFCWAINADPDVSSWDVANVTDMDSMFYHASIANPDVSSWNVSKVTSMSEMFQYSNLSNDNYDSLLVGWASLPSLQTGVTFHAGSAQYCYGVTARNDTLIGVYNWVITDGGRDPDCDFTAPVDFTAETFNHTQINLSWTKGAGADVTRIQRKTGGYPSSISDGINVYNDSGSIFMDTGLTAETRYYYRAWSYNETYRIWSSNSASVNNITIGYFPEIGFISPTPDNGTSQLQRYVTINASIVEDNLYSVDYNWDGTNHTMYDDSLVLMMNFDNVSALGENETHIVDVSGNGYNGTALNGSAPTTNGKYNGAFQFDGSNDLINVSAIQYGQAFTVSTWIKPTAWGTSGDQYIHNIFANEQSEGSTFSFRIGSKGLSSLRQKIAIAIYQGGGANDYESNSNLVLDTWQHVAATWDGSNVRFYINGVLDRTQSASITMDEGSNVFMVGHSPDYNRPYEGFIDELFVYNHTLSDGEIYQLYTSNLKKINQTQWYLYINQSKSATEGLIDGTYTYQIFASDDYSNTNQTDQRFITIQSITPTINVSIIYPIDKAAYTTIASFNYTVSGSSLDSCWYSIDDGVTNSSHVAAGVNFTGISLTAGRYNLTIYCNDTNGYIGSSTINFIVGDYSDADLVGKILASDGEASDYFGSAVSIYGDYAIVGAQADNSSKGSAYIYKKNDS